MLAALLGSGLTVDDLLDHQRGMPLPHELGADWSYDRSTGGARPPRPRLAVGLAGAAAPRSMAHPGQLPPLAVLAALTPAGTGTLARGRADGRLGRDR